MADKADKIMDAAIDKFAEKGYYNTKIADIVEAVGIAKGTFYLYFNSKKDLMLELIRRHRSMLKKSINLDECNFKENDVELFIEDFIKCFLRYNLKNKNLAIIIHREAVSVDKDFVQEYIKLDSEVTEILKGVYDILINHFHVDLDNDFEFFSNVFFGTMKSYIFRTYIVRNEDVNIEETSKKVAKYISRIITN
jgi:AcrR family transcriptional regulator